MSDRANILRLARNLARQNARRHNARLKNPNRELDLAQEIQALNLRTIPPALWDELDALLDHNPSLGLALARVLHAIAKCARNTRLRATADLALLRALNVCGEFKQTLALCPDAARRFEKLADTENIARVWLDAAWAETWLGELEAAKTYLEYAALTGDAYTNDKNALKQAWIHARILRLQGLHNQALAEFQVLAARLHAQKHTLEAARVQREIGRTQVRINPQDALPVLAQARQHFAGANCPLEAAQCDYFQAQALIDLNRFAQAEQQLTAIQALFKRHAYRFFFAWCDLELGFLRSEQDRPRDAIRLYQRARSAFVELDAAQEVASIDINLGWQLLRLNRYPEALAQFEAAAQIAWASGRQTKAALCFMNMGVALTHQGNYARAVAQHQRAREIFAREKMRERMFEVDLHLGQVYFQVGEYAQALRFLNEAHAVGRTQGMAAKLGSCELFRARVWMAQGKKASARIALHAARRLFEQNRQGLMAALCDRELASLEHKPAAARSRLRSSRRRFAAQGMAVDAALCDLASAELALQSGKLHAAERLLSQAERVLRFGFSDHYALLLHAFARLAHARGESRQALDFYVQAAQAHARVRGELELEVLSNSFFAARRRVLREGMRLARQQYSAEHALALIEAAKAQTFLHLLHTHEWRVDVPDEHLPALRERERALYYRLNQQRRQLVAHVAIDQVTVARGTLGANTAHAQMRALDDLAHEYETVAQELRLARHSLAGVPQLEPFSLNEFRAAARAQWGDKWLALDYYFERNRLYRVCISPERVTLDAQMWTSLDRRMLEQCTHLHPDVREVAYNGTLRGQSVPRAADPLAYLGARLLPPEIQSPAASSTLLIAPHGLLHQLAFGALRVNGAFLVESATVVTTPSLQSWTQLSRAQPRKTADRMLVCGVSEFGERERALPSARREVNALRRLNPNARVLWQTKATRETWMQWNAAGTLRKFSILHFATHAKVNLKAPHLSQILLGDEALTVLDLAQLALDARLVTLSACSGNIGVGGSGDEWVSLARALFYAGARGIVASLWNVDDASTALLMKLFYRHLQKGEPIATAMQHAQLTLLRKGYTPLQWAPFVAIGCV